MDNMIRVHADHLVRPISGRSTVIRNCFCLRLATSALAGLLLSPINLWADTGVLEEIVVTGSRIARDTFSSTAPISVFDSGELIRSGVVSVDEFLKEVPAFTGFQYGVSTNHGNIGLKAVSLRGLGPKRTLVLINGRRQVGSFIGGSSDVGAVDLNTIPHAMIGRVEVLKDGASTIYGSDALAGVVNIILKEDFEGLEVRAVSGAGTQGWDARNHGLAATLGLASERGRILIGAEYSRQRELLQAERDWALFDLHPKLIGGVFVATPGGSSNSRRIRTTEFDNAGNEALAAAGFPAGQQFILDAAGGRARPFIATDTYNYAPINALITPNERRQLTAMGAYDFSDRIAGFLEASYTRRQSHQRLAPDASFALNAAVPTPGHGPRWNDFVPASNPGNPFGHHPANPYGISGQHVRINRRYQESGGRLFEQSVDTYRAVAGLRGNLASGIAWEIAYTFADNEDSEDLRNYARFDRWAVMVDPAACRAVEECVAATGGAGYLSPFGDFGTIPDTAFDYLMADSLTNVRRNDMTVWSVNLSGELPGALQLGGGAVAWSAGYERREESAAFAPDPFVAEGLTTGGAPSPLAGGFRVDELYAETRLPLRDNLAVDLSARHSDYDTAGGTTNFGIGGVYSPSAALEFRATWSTGFRAPNVVELFGGEQSEFPIVEDPCEFYDLRNDPHGNLARNCAAAGFPPGFEWGFQWQAAYTAAAPPPGALKPEESTAWTLGAVWEPDFLSGLMVSLDYWDIEVTGFIGAPPYNSLLRTCLYAADQAIEPACGYFTEGTGHSAGVPDDASLPLANLGRVHTTGIDWNLSYAPELSLWRFGGIRFSMQATALLQYQETFPATGTNGRAGFIQGFSAYPEYKATLGVALLGQWGSLEWNARYISAMDDFLRPAHLTDDALAEAIWYHDVFVQYEFGQRVGLTLGIDNVFDETPPRFHSAFNAETDPGTYDTIGRRLFATLSLCYGKCSR